MKLKDAALLGLIGMILLTLLQAVGFIRDLLSLVNGAVAAVTVLISGIHLLASLGVTVFLYVFYKTQ